jgi:hypothetical protein
MHMPKEARRSGFGDGRGTTLGVPEPSPFASAGAAVRRMSHETPSWDLPPALYNEGPPFCEPGSPHDGTGTPPPLRLHVNPSSDPVTWMPRGTIVRGRIPVRRAVRSLSKTTCTRSVQRAGEGARGRSVNGAVPQKLPLGRRSRSLIRVLELVE